MLICWSLFICLLSLMLLVPMTWTLSWNTAACTCVAWAKITFCYWIIFSLVASYRMMAFAAMWWGPRGCWITCVFWESCWLTWEAIHGCGGGLRLASLLSFSIRFSYFSFISLTPWFSSSTVLSVIDAVVDSLWSRVSVAWGCKMASFAISPSSCTIFCRTSLHSEHLQWKEWKQPVRIDQDLFGVEILHPDKSHFLVLSGLILQWYPSLFQAFS